MRINQRPAARRIARERIGVQAAAAIEGERIDVRGFGEIHRSAGWATGGVRRPK